MKTASAPRLLAAGEVRPDVSWHLPMHLHRNHEMILVIGGRMTVVFGGGHTIITARPGDALLYPAGVAHDESSDPRKPVHTLYIAFESPAVTESTPRLSRDRDGRIRQMFRWILDDRDTALRESSALGEAFCAAAVAEYLRTLRDDSETALVTTTRRFIREQLHRPIDLDELAERAGLSRWHFLRRYRALAGRTPMDDLRRLRVESARQLLLTSDLPIKEVARRVGSANEYHLSRLFRRYLDTPPGAIRRQQRRK